MNKILYHTITIKLPEEQVYRNNKGKLKIAPTLTKTYRIARRLKIPSINFKSDEHILHPEIENRGTTTDYNGIQKTNFHTITIKVPKEQVFKSRKNGKMYIAPTLTKLNGLTSRQKELSLILEPNQYLLHPEFSNEGEIEEYIKPERKKREYKPKIPKQQPKTKQEEHKESNDKYENFKHELERYKNMDFEDIEKYKKKRLKHQQEKHEESNDKYEKFKHELERFKNKDFEDIEKYKKKKEEEPETERESDDDDNIPYDLPFLSYYLGITRNATEDRRINKYQALIFDAIFDIVNEHYLKQEILNFINSLKIPESVFNYFLNWVNKKINAGHGVEYSDFVKLVIYPQLLKNVAKDTDKVKLMMYANDIAHDMMFINLFSDKKGGEYQINKYTVIRTFLDKNISGLRDKIKRLQNGEVGRLLDDLDMVVDITTIDELVKSKYKPKSEALKKYILEQGKEEEPEPEQNIIIKHKKQKNEEEENERKETRELNLSIRVENLLKKINDKLLILQQNEKYDNEEKVIFNDYISTIKNILIEASDINSLLMNKELQKTNNDQIKIKYKELDEISRDFKIKYEKWWNEDRERRGKDKEHYHNSKKDDEIILPKPVPVEESLPESIKTLKSEIERFKEKGDELGAVNYDAGVIFQVIAYIALIIKYEKKCAIITEDLDNLEIGNIKNGKYNKKFFDNAETLSNDLLDCIERGEKIIAIPLSLRFGNREHGAGHANLLIYRPFEQIIERFEPHGQYVFTKNYKQDNLIFNSVLKEMFENKMKKYLGKYTPEYEEPVEVCPNLYGFQTIESQVAKIAKEGGGFCGAWYLFVLEMIFLNPTKSTYDIIDEALKISNKDKYYLSSLIRGYVHETELLIKSYIKTLDETSDFTFKNAKMTIWAQKDKIKMSLLKLLISFSENKKNSRIEKLEDEFGTFGGIFCSKGGKCKKITTCGKIRL